MISTIIYQVGKRDFNKRLCSYVNLGFDQFIIVVVVITTYNPVAQERYPRVPRNWYITVRTVSKQT